MIIILCGYMGSGKSLIGKKLAEKLDCPFMDLDDEIQKQEGKKISDIFMEGGEIEFRKRESECLKTVLNTHEDLVFSLGGGTPCYANNMAVIKNHKNALSFYLKVDLEVLTKRLFKEKRKRPLISEIETEEKLNDFIRKHLFERQFFYYQSDVSLDCSHLQPDEIVNEIYSLMEAKINTALKK